MDEVEPEVPPEVPEEPIEDSLQVPAELEEQTVMCLNEECGNYGLSITINGAATIVCACGNYLT